MPNVNVLQPASGTVAESIVSHPSPATMSEYQTRSESGPLHRLSNARSTEAEQIDTRSNSSLLDREPSPSASSECCGGFLDCDGLIEEDSGVAHGMREGVRDASHD
jgi:hypothetical protein